MIMKNPRYVNAQNGILLDYDQPGHPSLYVDAGELYDQAVNGDFGPVAAYVPPAPPSPSERVAAARSLASLSRREFFLALEVAGLYGAAMALRNSASLTSTTRIDLEHADRFDRTSPTVLAVATLLGLTESQIDQMFGIEVNTQ